MEHKRSSRAGGSIIAISILVGAVAGIVAGEPSIGFLVGAAFGAAVAMLLWLRDRKA